MMDFVKTIKSCLRCQYNRLCAWEKYIGKGRNGHREVKSGGYLTDIFTIYPLAVYFHYSSLLPPAFPNHLQCTNLHIFFPCLCKCSPSKTETPRKQTFLSLLFTTNHQHLEYFQTQSKILSEFSEWMNEWPHHDPSYFQAKVLLFMHVSPVCTTRAPSEWRPETAATPFPSTITLSTFSTGLLSPDIS